ncbi:hypothetical protein DL93DRAFT_2094536 [Clavulina sp. PMI_390]|nr:hypothetical protein DL93DRAFT_2094536 [Clavulina sp. PMI_390]
MLPEQLFLTALILHPPSRVYYVDPWTGSIFGEGGVDPVSSFKHWKEGSSGSRGGAGHSSEEMAMFSGDVIMPKLGNETAKAELGRAAWKLMHTMTLRYPDKPTIDERDALKSYFYLMSRLYPCGECAQEFQLLLAKYPPQTSSRQVASLWLCHVHNQVNSRLKKPEFDCTKLDETYDCGCGDAPLSAVPGSGNVRKEPTKVDEVTGQDMIKGGMGR